MTLEQWIAETNAAEVACVQGAEFVHMTKVAEQHNSKRRELIDGLDTLAARRTLNRVWKGMTYNEWMDYVSAWSAFPKINWRAVDRAYETITDL